jgi:hypothetical protein
MRVIYAYFLSGRHPGMYRTFDVVDVINRERNEAMAQHTSGNLKRLNIQHPLLP